MSFHKIPGPVFAQDRNRMLASENEDIWLAYYRKYEIDVPQNHVVFLASVHKARTAIRSLAIEKRRASKAWLTAHGFHSMDDGEL